MTTKRPRSVFGLVFSRISLVSLGLALLLVAILARCDLFEPPPNVLIITVDALRADHLDVYGYERETAPELAALAAKGTRFDAATAQAPVTIPSLYMIMTGELFYYIDTPSGIETLAERLKARGYTTAAFLRNPLMEINPSGMERGFDTFFVPEALSNDDTSGDKLHPVAERQLYGQNLRAETLLSKAEEWLQQNGDDEPFFLWIHLFDPHDPYSPPPPYDSRFDSGYSGGVDGDIRRTKDSDAPIWGEVETNPPPEDRRHIAALYDGEIRYASERIGKFLDDFCKSEVSGRTLTVFSSDHGESLGEHRMWGHGVSLYESELRIPLFMIWPGRIPAGKVISQPVESLDIVPTILSLVGARVDKDLPGKNMAPLFEDISIERDGVFARWGGERSYREGRWKLIIDKEKGAELYDLEADPREENNLASEEPGILIRMKNALDKSAARETKINHNTGEPARDKLKSLGYL